MKKKLPASIRVMGFDMVVSSPNEVLDAKNAYGNSSWDKQTIHIDDHEGMVRQQQTLIHELLHTASAAGLAIDDQLSERQVRATASVLHQIFRDNPAVLEFLR